jgi:negative regulator of flagellin synthesis FlgM
MVSEVNNSPSGAVGALEPRSPRVDKPAAATPQGAAAQPEVVSLTDLGSRLQALSQAIADVPAVDSERVEFFRQAIADGSYRIDADAVADKLANFEALLANLPQNR